MKKRGRKILSVCLSILTIISMVGIMPSYAQEIEPVPEFGENEIYAIVSSTTDKAIQTRAVGWGESAAVHVDGVVVDGKVKEKAAFSISKTADGRYNFSSIGNDGKLLKNEGGISFVFNYDNLPGGNDHKFAIEPVEGGYKIKGNPGMYLGLGENGRLDKVEDDQAEIFTFMKVSILDETLKIENVETGKLVSFKDQENLSAIKVNGDKNNITDDEKFIAEYTTCNNYLMDYLSEPINTVGLRPKSHSNMVIISANWIDGPVSAIVAKEANTGGWESIVIEAVGNGHVALRSSYTHQYVTVNENDELELCDKTFKELTEREKFIIHTDLVPEAISDLTIDDDKRTESELNLHWTIPNTLYTENEVYYKGPSDSTFAYLTTLTNESSLKVEGLSPNNTYEFKIRTVNGRGEASQPNSLAVFSNQVSAKTRAGKKPNVPENVQLKTVNENNQLKGFEITWDESDHATHYLIRHAPSMFGEYKTMAIVKGTSYVDRSIGNDKYSHYYKIVAVNNGASDENVENGEKSMPSVYTSLETKTFGRNMFFISPTDSIDQIDALVQQIYIEQSDASQDAQFNEKRYSIYYKPGDYTNTKCIPVGFYTHIGGLGKTPYDVQLNNIEVPAYLSDYNATCNFWRSAENVSVVGSGNATTDNGNWKQGSLNWSVAQAAPIRRVYSTRTVSYDWNYGWASGGYTADCLFTNGAGTFSGQQYFTRNSVLGKIEGTTTLNNFNMGVVCDDLPNDKTGQPLLNGNGYSNWGIASSDGGQQVTTNVLTTPKVREKPFLFIDSDGEYKIFVPDYRENSSGISWGSGKANDGMGEGEIVSLDEFYIAKEGDTAKKINKQLEEGKNIFFTPGVYHAEDVIQINNAQTIVLGTGMASIIPDNEEGAMKVADKDGIIVSGLIFDAGSHSRYLLTVGEEGKHINHSSNPTFLQDLFFRVGGTTSRLTKADNALIIHSDDVISDHFWIWRADHGAGVEWYGNESQHGLIVNGDRVACYALFNEHFQKYHTLWNGEDGSTYFYQNETAYDPISQEAWMSHNGTVNGYASYKVSNQVKNHYAIGLGVYNVFIYTGPTYDSSEVQIQLDNAIEVPNSEGVIVENACIQTFANTDGVLQKINSIVNGAGAGVSSGIDKDTGLMGEGWSRKFLLSYQNGTAVVGKTPNATQLGKYIGVDTLTNVKDLGDDDIDTKILQKLYDQQKSLVETQYTKESWAVLNTQMQQAQKLLTSNLKYAYQKEFDNAVKELQKAVSQLVKKEVDKTGLQKLYTTHANKDSSRYTEKTWTDFYQALQNAKKVLDNKNATQNEVDAAYKSLENAVNHLQEKTVTPTSPKPEKPGGNSVPSKPNSNGGVARPVPDRVTHIIRDVTNAVVKIPTNSANPTTPVEGTQIDENDTPLTNITPEETIKENETPTSKVEGSWALINLIAVIVTILLGIVMLVMNKKDVKRFIGIIIACSSMVIFVLTEDLSMPMAMADQWTILMIVIALINVIILVTEFYRKPSRPKPQTVS